MRISGNHVRTTSRLSNLDRSIGAVALRLLIVTVGVIVVSAPSTRGQGFTKTYAANDGANWTQANTGLTNLRTKALAVDPNNPSTLFVATERGLFKSINGGNAWNASGLADQSVTAIAIDPRESKTIFASVLFSGIVKSTDGGATWRSVGPQHLTVNLILVDPRNSTTLYAAFILATGDGFLLLKSTDTGESWTQVTALDYGYLAIDSVNPDILYLTSPYSEDNPRASAIYKTNDGGQSWSHICCASQTLYIERLVVDPVDSNLLYAGPDSLRSDDGGKTWSSRSSDPSFDRIVANPNNPDTRYATSPYNGVYKSEDGGATWSLFNDGLTYLDSMGGLALSPSNPPTLYTGSLYHGVFRSGSMLTLDRSSYSIETNWNLRVSDSAPNAPIRLIGTSNGAPWEIPAWGVTDANGNFSASGKFVDGSQGSHIVQVEIAGIISNVVSLIVSDRKLTPSVRIKN